MRSVVIGASFVHLIALVAVGQSRPFGSAVTQAVGKVVEEWSCPVGNSAGEEGEPGGVDEHVDDGARR